MKTEHESLDYGRAIEASYPRATKLALTTPDFDLLGDLSGLSPVEKIALELMLDCTPADTIYVSRTPELRQWFIVGQTAEFALQKIEEALKRGQLIQNGYL